jgi:hypothetical protein
VACVIQRNCLLPDEDGSLFCVPGYLNPPSSSYLCVGLSTAYCHRLFVCCSKSLAVNCAAVRPLLQRFNAMSVGADVLLFMMVTDGNAWSAY